VRFQYHIYLFISAICFLTGCAGTSHLQKNEYLLAEQYVVGNKKVQTADLEPYYLQNSNRKILGLPIWLWVYELGERYFNRSSIEKKYQEVANRYDEQLAAAAYESPQWDRLQEIKKNKLKPYAKLLQRGNFLMQIGEPPALYSPKQQSSTEKNLVQYLHTKGYFHAQVASAVWFKGTKAYVRYKIQENKPSIVREVRLNVPDAAIREILTPYVENSLLQKGHVYDQDVLAAERDRIYELLLSKGYWGFSKQYISFNVDNTSLDNTVAIETALSLPADETAHPAYQVSQVDFAIVPDVGERLQEDTTTYEGVTFKNTRPYFSPRALIDKISIRPGHAYSHQEVISMQKRLAYLDLFKIVRVSYEPLDQGNLATRIHASLRDKFQFEHEVGTEFTNNSSIPFYQFSLKSRNMFRQLDILTARSQFSIELGSIPLLGESQFYSVQNFHTSLGLQVPQLWLPISASKRASLERYQSLTKIDLGYTFANQPNYASYNLKAILAYTWQPSQNITFELTPLGIGLMDFRLKPKFEQELQERKDEGDLAYKRYTPALQTSTTFKATFNTKKDPAQESSKSNKEYTSLEFLLESSGALQSIVDIEHLLSQRLTYYRYVRGGMNYSQHIPGWSNSVFAYHVTMGLLYLYGTAHTAPPDKYYFIGGPSSIRAWDSRSLGPGSYRSKVAKTKERFDERPGEVMLQANVEWRKPLVGFLEGAVFVEIGNVWTLDKSLETGKDFAWDRFYQELGVGAGVGLRLNFNVIVLRLDAGFKVYDPAGPAGARIFSDIYPTFHFALAYPF
jgi:outer membrane protein insertion porin family